MRGRRRWMGNSALLAVMGLIAVLPGRAPDTSDKTVPGTLRFVVYGDSRDGHAVHNRLVMLTMKQNPELVLLTGDLVHTGSDDQLWKIYDDITGSMRKQIPVYPARGNHDTGGAGYEARVTAPYSSGNRLFYS